MKRYIYLILLFVFHFASGCHDEKAAIKSAPITIDTDVKSESQVFKNKSNLYEATTNFSNKVGPRKSSNYYANRAYVGAPPQIPHVGIIEGGDIGKSCLSCHRNGGFVKKYSAFAPVSPHPEYINCVQCHVPIKTGRVFKRNFFRKILPPETNQRAIVKGPPVIPHDLQLRGNCHSCHSGSAAIREIKTTHPERENCRQCHLPRKTDNIWKRG